MLHGGDVAGRITGSGPTDVKTTLGISNNNIFDR